MYTFNLLALTAVTLAGFSSADCYGDGPSWTDSAKTSMLKEEQLNSICSGLIGDYIPGERRRTCLEVVDIGKLEVMVHLVSSNFRTMGLAECRSGVSKEISGCTHGGKSKYTNWEYQADLNKGKCTAPTPEKRSHARQFQA
ncbi:uncharacterized protein EI97DRAFT_504780 [Westerdykella ornata]|uniref:Uncharacterized protein n=1 Tax=Westerdykella ornata TaxID=318751 RepID=A0A6A6J6E6_WESOR|nr:uncharacterized protein EI97DRAFT_504780 [Westerdykella ornata]KAF2271713.1 hypothetical protein EI97DRAFT_504780 [Westerdykella ornata]